MTPLFWREKSSLKGRWRLETVQDMRSSSSNPVSCAETPIKIYGSKEEIRARKSPETVDAPGFAPDASIPVTLYGGDGEIRTLEPLLTVTRFPVVRPRPTRRHLHVVIRTVKQSPDENSLYRITGIKATPFLQKSCPKRHFFALRAKKGLRPALWRTIIL